MTHLEILKSVRKLLSQSSAWNQGNYAVNKEGTAVAPQDLSAVRWCLIGAVARSEESPNDTWQILGFSPEKQSVVENLLRLIREENPHNSQDVWQWNDAKGRTHEDVIALIDIAIMKTQREAVDIASQSR